MPIANGLVQSLVRSDHQHVGADGPAYELLVLDAQRAVALLTVWDQTSTFTQCVAGQPNPKAFALATTLSLEVPVLVSAWPRRLGLPDWAPKGAPEDIIVVEGNHRLLALAMRLEWKWQVPRCIGVFVRTH